MVRKAATPSAMRARPIACAVLATLIVSPVAAQSVRDSAGVRIIENDRPAWSRGQAWRLSPEPVLEIGVVEGDPDYQLYRARFVQRLPDGRIVLANTGTHEIRAYSPNGRHLFSAGGPGEGPGEFRSIDFLGVLPGDTLVAFDRSLDRVSLFTDRGGFIRSFRLDPLEGIGTPWVRGLFSSGHLWVGYSQGWGLGSLRDGHHRNSIFYAVHDLEGSLRHGFGELIFSEMWVVNEPNRSSYLQVPFQPFSTLSVAGDSLAHGWTAEPTVAIYDRTGRLRRSIRWRAVPVPVSRADIRRFQDLRYPGEDERSRRVRAAHADMPIPSAMPYYRHVILDRTGHLWVANYAPWSDSPLHWKVFDPEGRWLGEIERPARFTAQDIGPDWILGTFVDDLDVQRVRLYRLERPGH